MEPESLYRRLRRFDDQRPGLPGEHWWAFAAGVWLLTRRADSPLGRLLSVAAGAALIARAASGRGGLARLLPAPGTLKRFAGSRRGARSNPRLLDLSQPWPERRRVRVPAISQPFGRAMQTR